jgi:hypothetical protein
VKPRPWLLLVLLLPAIAHAREEPASLEASLRRCQTQRGLRLLISPELPARGEPLRVVVVSERPRPGAKLVALGPDGAATLAGLLARGGPPHWWHGQLESPTAGLHRFALLGEDGALLACGRRRVEPRRPRPAPLAAGPHWVVRGSWSRSSENLYAAWIEKLFDAPVGAQVGWTPLHQVIRDPARNFLHNHLGANEDGPDAARAVVVQPDCADLPYFVRAYFAWKLGLPFGYRHCDRGSSSRPTRCETLSRGNLSPAEAGGSLASRFSRFLRGHVSLVHSGSGRTGPDDDETDLYPLKLSRASLRPGTVYVDPYGHLLVISRWVEQGAGKGGLLYAVDGHPDLSVGRKRFWRGAFMFHDRIQGGAGGFKAFRPLVQRKGVLHALGNAEIKASPDYANLSSEQYKIGIDGFYDRMDAIISPRPLPPQQAYRERLDALHELILERVGSVQAGEDQMKKTGAAEIAMPRGPKIFETKGPWEDFSTPARDLRLLIAIEEVQRFPEKLATRPERFAFASGQTPAAARRELLALFEKVSREKTFTYKRSDGSDWKLTMADLVARRKGLEVAYNPNDCAEIRWAAEGAELSTCRRRAPEAQRRLMERSFRSWFATRTRPPLR